MSSNITHIKIITIVKCIMFDIESIYFHKNIQSCTLIPSLELEFIILNNK